MKFLIKCKQEVVDNIDKREQRKFERQLHELEKVLDEFNNLKIHIQEEKLQIDDIH